MDKSTRRRIMEAILGMAKMRVGDCGKRKSEWKFRRARGVVAKRTRTKAWWRVMDMMMGPIL
jgi:hypothetical protein